MLAGLPLGTPPQDPRPAFKLAPRNPCALILSSRRPANPSRRLPSLRGSRASCAAAPALLRRPAVGPSPRSDSTPTPGTSPKHSPPTPTRVRAKFRPEFFPPQVSSAASPIPRRRQRSGRPNPVCTLAARSRADPRGPKAWSTPASSPSASTASAPPPVVVVNPLRCEPDRPAPSVSHIPVRPIFTH